MEVKGDIISESSLCLTLEIRMRVRPGQHIKKKECREEVWGELMKRDIGLS